MSPGLKKAILIGLVQSVATYFIIKAMNNTSAVKKLDKKISNETN